MNQEFYTYKFKTGKLADIQLDQFPSELHALENDQIRFEGNNNTCFGFVHQDQLEINCSAGSFKLKTGMYFSCPSACEIKSSGQAIFIIRKDYKGLFAIGGPIEDQGRLKYIDGCTDSLLIPPVVIGDPCLNLLHFPPGIDQTLHTHPSARIGIITRGNGECITPEKTIPLEPGVIFIIHKDCQHKFRTGDNSMSVIAYHPDSDFGPNHQDHPMINRTIVDGISAKHIEAIQTR